MILKQKKDLGYSDAELEARNAIKVGTTLYGHCCGYFGRDSYGHKEIVDIKGNWVTVSECDHSGNRSLNSGYIRSFVDLVEASNASLEDECRVDAELEAAGLK